MLVAYISDLLIVLWYARSLCLLCCNFVGWVFAIWVGFLVGFDFVVAGFDWGLMLPLTPFGGL